MRAVFNPMNKQPTVDTAQMKQIWNKLENSPPNWLLAPLLFYQTNDWLSVILMVSVGLVLDLLLEQRRQHHGGRAGVLQLGELVEIAGVRAGRRH